MSRDVKDKVVLRQCEARNMYDLYIQPLHDYPNIVVDKHEKICLNKSSYGLTQVSPIANIERVYNSLNIKDEVCSITTDSGLNIEVPCNKFKLIKALVISQVSSCKEFNDVVGGFAMQLIVSTITGRPISLNKPEQLSEFQSKLFDDLLKFVSKYI